MASQQSNTSGIRQVNQTTTTCRSCRKIYYSTPVNLLGCPGCDQPLEPLGNMGVSAALVESGFEVETLRNPASISRNQRQAQPRATFRGSNNRGERPSQGSGWSQPKLHTTSEHVQYGNQSFNPPSAPASFYSSGGFPQGHAGQHGQNAFYGWYSAPPLWSQPVQGFPLPNFNAFPTPDDALDYGNDTGAQANNDHRKRPGRGNSRGRDATRGRGASRDARGADPSGRTNAQGRQNTPRISAQVFTYCTECQSVAHNTENCDPEEEEGKPDYLRDLGLQPLWDKNTFEPGSPDNLLQLGRHLQLWALFFVYMQDFLLQRDAFMSVVGSEVENQLSSDLLDRITNLYAVSATYTYRILVAVKAKVTEYYKKAFIAKHDSHYGGELLGKRKAARGVKSAMYQLLTEPNPPLVEKDVCLELQKDMLMIRQRLLTFASDLKARTDEVLMHNRSETRDRLVDWFVRYPSKVFLQATPERDLCWIHIMQYPDTMKLEAEWLELKPKLSTSDGDNGTQG